VSVATVRMYNVGFGDCFLVRLATPGGDRTMLVDCGSHPMGPGPWPIAEVAQSIVADLGAVAAGSPRIDVVVATHRHADHIAGFGPQTWSGVDVGEVWLPWIEDRDDPAARHIRDAQQHLAAALAATLTHTRATAAALDLLANSVANEDAMQTLRTGFAGHPAARYLPGAGGPDMFETPLLPGVKVHVMGPSRDPAVIRDMDPPNGQSYLASLSSRIARSVGDLEGQRLVPFPGHGQGLPASLPRDLRAVELAARYDPFELAVALEDAVNGTSLMLALEIGADVLLFPGDAQWGTWNAAMANPAWAALLRRLTFLKVGHHGSHNATPVGFVEDLLPAGIPAMCSTRHMNRWPRIPRAPLLERLVAKGTRLVRSDALDAVPTGFTVGPNRRWVELSV
jgi:beta-lactamase superfamily II metal-dependent hydrolase